MAGVLGRTALLSSLKKSTSKASGGLLLRGVNRSASNGILTEGSKDTLIAIAGAGMLGVTCYAVYTGVSRDYLCNYSPRLSPRLLFFVLEEVPHPFFSSILAPKPKQRWSEV